MNINHPFNPIFTENSKILILGTMPSVASRDKYFYYAHPRNRFWNILYQLFAETINDCIEDKIEFLNRHHIALWDVLKSCDIKGSSDASIKNPIPNDILSILNKTSIDTIFTTGKTAHKYYQKLIFPITKKEDICLPSTSPANATINYHELLEEYKKIKQALEK